MDWLIQMQSMDKDSIHNEKAFEIYNASISKVFVKNTSCNDPRRVSHICGNKMASSIFRNLPANANASVPPNDLVVVNNFKIKRKNKTVRRKNIEVATPKKKSPTSTFDLENGFLINDDSVANANDSYIFEASIPDASFNFIKSIQPTTQGCIPVVTSLPTPRPPLKPNPRNFLRTKLDENANPKTIDVDLGNMMVADERLNNHDFGAAICIYESLLSNLHQTSIGDTSEKALCHQKIGEAYLLWKDYSNAANNFEVAIHMRSSVLGFHHLDVAFSLESLAISRLFLNQIEESHSSYRSALRIKRNVLGFYHEDVAHILTQLACIYFFSNQIMSSQAAFEDVFDIFEGLAKQSISNSHLWEVKAADTLCSIGFTMLKQKRYSDASPYFLDALNRQSQIYGLKHPSVSITLDNLGYAYYKDKKYSLAAKIYSQLLDAQIDFFQGFNIDCFSTLKKLTRSYEKENQISAAIHSIKIVLSLQENTDSDLIVKTEMLLQILEEKCEKYWKCEK